MVMKICVKKITKIYSRQGAASKMFRDGGANASFSLVDFSPISMGQILCSKYNFMCFCKYTTIFSEDE
jgi:hypothetical protein